MNKAQNTRKYTGETTLQHSIQFKHLKNEDTSNQKSNITIATISRVFITGNLLFIIGSLRVKGHKKQLQNDLEHQSPSSAKGTKTPVDQE